MEELHELTDLSDLSEIPLSEPEPAPPIESRFLFVDIAALRAKQLRRGARVRLTAPEATQSSVGQKPERLAMEEVRRGRVYYDLPEPRASRPEDTA
jgi:DNA-directed RNA polymerase subunit K/omega